MSGARIEIALEGSALRTTLGALAERLGDASDLADLHDAIGALLADGVQRRFIAAKDPDGTPWVESDRAKAGARGGRTLTDTGRLQHSITWSVEADGVLVGTNVEYAAIHQFGGEIEQSARAQVLAFDGQGRFAARKSTRRRKTGSVPIAIAQIGARRITLPARPFLGIDAEDRAGLAGVMQDWLEAALP
ncbi:phage virion morphogenesis protein [Ruegeria sp.]|uniref:phage virion morphogenesis protein n=1 Tax=Ruegeria sp. TaxID=1879320 RepID=UPI003B002523